MSNVVERTTRESDIAEFERPAVTGVFGTRTNPAQLPAELTAEFEAIVELPYRVARRQAIAAIERTYVRALLERCGGNVSKSARLAGLDRVYLHRLIRKHALQDVTRAGRNSVRPPEP